MTSLQGNWRVQTAFTKKKRLIAQGIVLKAWKDYLAKKDFDMTSNMLGLRFIQANKRYTLSHCFHALLKYKQTKKARVTRDALEQDMDPSLQQTTDYLHSSSLKL